MALLIITGVPGTGKTLYAIQKYIIPHLQKGGIVYTNIDGLIASRIAIFYDIDVFICEENLRILNNPDYFYKEICQNAMVVIDEAQNLFSNRDLTSATNKDCILYLNQHRHYGHKVIFVTPHVDLVDAGIRRIVEFTYKNKSFSALGSSKVVRCAVFDQCNVLKPAIQFFTWKHDTKIYECYSSYFSDGTTETKVRVSPLKNAQLYFIAIIVFIALFFAFNNGKYFVAHLKTKEKKVDSVVIQNVEKKNKISIIKVNDSIIYRSERLIRK